MTTQTSNECKCAWPCSRNGNCEACQEYHRKDSSFTNCGKDGKKPGQQTGGAMRKK